MHVSDEDLILLYYDEASTADRARADRHLAVCASCRANDARLREVLALVDSAPAAQPGEGFERQMWARLQDRLTPAEPWSRRGVVGFRGRWATAAAMATLVLAAFMAGWLARGRPDAPTPTAIQADVTPIGERVLIVAVGDHLERSQMVLVELMNTPAAATVNITGEQARAEDLVATNRLFRQTAAYAGDAALDDVLDDLERVLMEIVNGPAEVTADELNALRARIESRGILFRVRVLSSEIRERERQGLSGRRSGSTS
jgi:hypothetical protein